MQTLNTFSSLICSLSFDNNTLWVTWRVFDDEMSDCLVVDGGGDDVVSEYHHTRAVLTPIRGIY